jgi:ligand-binding sensor domain-containing protein
MEPSARICLKRPRGLRAAWVAGVLALQFLVITHGLALDPARSISQYNCRNWTRQHGLPVDQISCVTQSRDGYLWLGTQDGLVRFDGLAFQVIPIALPSAQGHDVRNLVACRDGKILFSIQNGGFGRYDGTTFLAIDGAGWSQPGMDTEASAIMEARDGAIWAANGRAVDRWSAARETGSFPGSTNMGPVISLCEDPAGGIWLGTAEHGLYCWAQGKLVAIDHEPLTKQNIFALAADPSGQIWIGTGFGLQCCAGGQVSKVPGFDWPVTALLVDRQGILWVGTASGGVARHENGKFDFLRKVDGLGSDFVTSLCEDAEGSLWVGTRDGLSQLSDVKLPIYSANQGIGDGACQSVAASKNGGLWIATDSGLSYFDGKTATNYPDASLIPNTYVKLCFEARNGEIYAEDGEKNINIISDGRLLARLTNSIWTSAITEDSHSVLVAAGTGDAVFRIRDGELHHYQYKDGAPPLFYWINNLFVARDDAVWVASKNGIFRLQDGAVQHWTMTNGLSSDNALWVCQDGDGSIWVGLATGIARIKDGQIKNIKPEDGLADSWIYAVVPDDCGWFWFSSSHGIFRIRRAELNDFAEGKAIRVNCELFNGLEAVKSTGRSSESYSACKTRDGRIWVPGSSGVVMIDAAHIFTNGVPPPVHINRVLANGKEFSPAGNITVPPGRGDLQFEFAGLSYIAPEKIRFRYQLEGFDHDWVNLNGHQVSYSNLKPGRYTFRVTAANADGIWNQTGDSLAVKLLPHFEQTLLFYSLCGGLGLALLMGIHFRRIRNLELKQGELQEFGRRLETEVRKRTTELAERTQTLEQEIEERKRMGLEIEQVHRQLLETSRQAGMAEVATSVLHNIGNVLNSVNISATLVADKLKQSKISQVGKVASLMSQHAADLAGFLTAHPQGRHLPVYLDQLAGQLVQEQQTALVELGLLRENIEHIKDIVAMQQNYAKISGVTESVKVADLVEDALRMNAGELARHDIKLVRDYADLPPIVVEKHKVLQILVNLIRNAEHACDEADRNDKELRIGISAAGGGIQICVVDNGIGIPAENLTRIFNHGFTTRKGGHGFALHNGALSARALGGSLKVHSDGPGLGATFTLTLPLRPPRSHP